MSDTLLFANLEQPKPQPQAPLAYRMAPKNFDDYLGQDRILGPDKPLRKLIEADKLGSIILWGPPGCGKTALSRLISQKTKSLYLSLNAVTAKISDIKDSIEAAKKARFRQQKTVLFIDEIHRFNKIQQDALLPEVESGLLTLIGATTENPFFSVIPALISRSQIFELHALSDDALTTLLTKTCPLTFTPEAKAQLLHHAQGDARKLLNRVESIVTLYTHSPITLDDINSLTQTKGIPHNKDSHYDIISALIKTMRASQPDTAIYWLARLLKGGEDPAFIARRLIVFASEDIGNADPHALVLTTSLLQAVHFIGMPEIRINLSQAVLFLANAPKNRDSYNAIQNAYSEIDKGRLDRVPDHLRNYKLP